MPYVAKKGHSREAAAGVSVRSASLAVWSRDLVDFLDEPEGLLPVLMSGGEDRRAGRVATSLTFARLIDRNARGPGLGLKFALRCALDPMASFRWLEFMQSHPALKSAPDYVRSVMADKIHRPFGRKGLSRAERVDWLIEHYRTLARIASQDVQAKLISGYRFPVAELRGSRSGTTYTITLSREILSQHQGELTLLFIDPGMKAAVVRMAINLRLGPNDKPHVVICGLQSAKPEHKDDIVRITRDLDGLRPKRAVMEAIFAMARSIDAEALTATALENHVSQSKAIWRRKIFTDYDAFWQEFAMGRLATGGFQFPLRAAERDPASVPGKKRKAWLKRQDHLARISEDVGFHARLFGADQVNWRARSQQTLYSGRQTDLNMEVEGGLQGPWVVEHIAA